MQNPRKGAMKGRKWGESEKAVQRQCTKLIQITCNTDHLSPPKISSKATRDSARAPKKPQLALKHLSYTRVPTLAPRMAVPIVRGLAYNSGPHKGPRVEVPQHGVSLEGLPGGQPSSAGPTAGCATRSAPQGTDGLSAPRGCLGHLLVHIGVRWILHSRVGEHP